MEDKSTPLFEMLLNTANERLRQYDELICNSREVLDRLNTRRIKPEPAMSGKIEPPSEIENTIANRFAIFCESFDRSNKKMEELYGRLRELA